MGPYVAFFRGINVGGRHLVKMEALRKLYESLGFENVRTLLQSGNVVFESSRKKTSAAAMEEAFEKEFGFWSTVIVRTAKELRSVAEACPFGESDGKKPNWIAVAFFPGKVDAKAKQALEAYSGPELVEIGEREIFVYYAEGMGRSKLPLKGDCTVRNWNTIAKLLQMTA